MDIINQIIDIHDNNGHSWFTITVDIHNSIMVIHNYIMDIHDSFIDMQTASWVNMVENPLITVQCAIMLTHYAIILNVHDPIMNGVHNYSMDIHMQFWIWYPYAILDVHAFQE